MCSDNTGNTRRGRKDAQEEIQTMMNLADCCHHLQNTIKYINKLPHFQQMSRSLQNAIRHFSKSNLCLAELQKAREELDVTQGLVKIGKTRFATHWSAAVAMDRCLPILKQLVVDRRIELKVCFLI